MVEDTVSFGDSTNPEPIREFPRIVRLASGSFYVTGSAPGELRIYASDGGFERSVHLGPGSPNLPPRLVSIRALNGDSIWAVGNNGRAYIVSDDDRIFREYSVPVRGLRLVELSDSIWLMSGAVPTADRIGYLYHTMDREGRIDRSFEGGTRRVDPTAGGTENRLIAAARDGRFWSASPGRYELELRDREGKVLRSLAREPVGLSFAEPGSRNRGPHLDPPDPRLTDIRQDSNGLIWVMIAIADPEWRPLAEEGDPPMALTALDLVRSWDTLVEVIDPVRGTLIASSRYPEMGIGFVDDRSFAVVGTDGFGALRPVVLRVRVLESTHQN